MLPMYLGVFLALALQDNEVEEGSGRAWEVGSLHSRFFPWKLRPSSWTLRRGRGCCGGQRPAVRAHRCSHWAGTALPAGSPRRAEQGHPQRGKVRSRSASQTHSVVVVIIQALHNFRLWFCETLLRLRCRDTCWNLGTYLRLSGLPPPASTSRVVSPLGVLQSGRAKRSSRSDSKQCKNWILGPVFRMFLYFLDPS